MLPYLLEALQSELPNYCYTGLTIINKLTDVVHLQPKYLFSVAEKIISSAILDPKTKILSMICLTNRQDISEFSLTFLQSLFQLEDFYNLFDTLDGVNFENFSRSVFISSIKNIEKIQQYEFDPQFLHFIDISLQFSQLIYVYAEKIVEYMKENEFTKIISDVVAILVKNNSDISKYFKNCSNPNILSYLAKFQSENSSNGDLIVSKTCSVKLICKKLMKSYEQKINLTLNELDRVISILTRNTTFSIFKLFSLSPEIITFNFDILTMNKIRSAAARVLSSFPCQSLSILNEKYNAMFIDGSLIGDIFNCPLSVIHIIPIILKELKCSIGDRHLIFLLSKNPPFYSPLLISVLNAIQIGIEDPLEFLASLECDNEVLANLLTQIDQLIYDTDVIFAIALIKIKINISLDKIPCYLSKLYDLIFKKMSIKCHKKESISDIVLSKKMTKLCLESSSNSHDVLIDTILWSIYEISR
ncbi:hypothetical protein MXB_2485 [Myxobolus squamalis]|nr:hypothetical protein MXB_2485 [Myxobolus squamalis]